MQNCRPAAFGKWAQFLDAHMQNCRLAAVGKWAQFLE